MPAKHHILSVDDNLTNQEILSELLQLEGYRVTLADNGKVALDQINSDRPDLILMDLLMPVMDGFEATARIRQTPEFVEIPIIAVSASINEDTVSKSMKAGCNRFIGKPIDYSKLFDTIDEYLVDTTD